MIYKVYYAVGQENAAWSIVYWIDKPEPLNIVKKELKWPMTTYSVFLDTDKLGLNIGDSRAASALLHAERLFAAFRNDYWFDDLGKVKL